MSPEHLPPAVTQDRVLGGRLVLCQPEKGHRVGHDAILLAAAAPRETRRLADFGAGVGSAGLAALLRLPHAEAVLVEIDPALADLAGRNAAANGFAARCAVVCADVLALARPGGPPLPLAESLDLVLANPPFNATDAHQTSPDAGRARAHMAQSHTLRDWATAAYRCLAPGGTLAMILRPEDLSTLLAALEGRLGAVRLLPVHPRPEAPAVRLIARAIKGRRTAPAILPGLILAGADGAPTLEAEAVLREGQALLA
ncbi:tRNA1(Val) (adenine(37)-N6)-methyltransferase [Roseixanthobacter liquoris]|uniref:tRNA1(Val) (adenine(37)-N6)-methyltransferase n=1 Tax=Roseixanthobacter liquoris TaxID=3119921 RepID=UPI00372B425B